MVQVSVLGQGGAPLGDLYQKIDDATALGALTTAYEAGVTFFDTSPWYGVGLSECRFGLALHRLPRDSFKVSTKVGRFLVPDAACVNGTRVGWIGGFHMRIRYDYTSDAFERQLADSLQRTGLGRMDSLVVHDLEPVSFHDPAKADDGVSTARVHLAALRTSGFGALQRMRAAGTIGAFGAGINSVEDGEDPEVKRGWNREYAHALLTMHEGSGERGIDFLLLANMHSLLNSDARDIGILSACAARGVSVIIGGPYSSGILATGADPAGGGEPMYNYLPASAEVRARTRRIEATCARHGVPLIAAALQYPLRHPSVACVIPGGKNPVEVASNVALMNVAIPEPLWAELEAAGLIPREG